jgi:bacterioferritin (cytochrome b1)
MVLGAATSLLARGGNGRGRNGGGRRADWNEPDRPRGGCEKNDCCRVEICGACGQEIRQREVRGRKGRGHGRRGGGGNGGRGGGNGGGNGRGGGDCLDPKDPAPEKASEAYLASLQSTLEKELYARDYYLAASKALKVRRYGNLARAEQNHADAIAAAITRLGSTPTVSHDEEVKTPATSAEADAECTKIENTVIEVYTGLIKDCPDDAVLGVLENIQRSNRRHLAAVSR